MTVGDDMQSASDDMIDTSMIDYVVENADSADEAAAIVEENVPAPTADDLWSWLGSLFGQ